MAGIWALPGPARLARAVRTLLDRGYSVFIGLPVQVIDDSAFCSGLLASVDYAVDLVDCHESGADRCAHWLQTGSLSTTYRPARTRLRARSAFHAMGRVLAIMVPVDEWKAHAGHLRPEFVAGARGYGGGATAAICSRQTCAAEPAGWSHY